MKRGGAVRMVFGMTTATKLITGGVATVLAVGVAAVIALSFDNRPAPATSPGPQAPTRAVADNATARTIYDGAKDSVAYITSNMAEGQATGSGFAVTAD